VLEGPEVEVGIELAVEHGQEVAVERRRHPGGVVVGRFEHCRVLDEVGAEQQPVLLAQEAAERPQEAAAPAGQKVADRAAEEGDDARTLAGRDLAEVALEVAEDPVHAQPRVLLDELVGARPQDRLGDVERDVAVERSRRVHRVEQHARLVGHARAELDELGRPRRRDQLRPVGLEDRALGAGGVVLGLPADLVEEPRALGVVEVLRRELLERAGQPVERVVGQRPLLSRTEMDVDPDRARVHPVEGTPTRARRRRAASRPPTSTTASAVP
jgi:hypothetical protein